MLQSPFVCFNTDMYKKLSCSPCLFGPFDEALPGEKVSVSAHNVREIDTKYFRKTRCKPKSF